jgi:hypothetical protein
MLSFLIRRLIYIAIYTVLLNIATRQFYMKYLQLRVCSTRGSVFLPWLIKEFLVFYESTVGRILNIFLELD